MDGGAASRGEAGWVEQRRRGETAGRRNQDEV